MSKEESSVVEIPIEDIEYDDETFLKKLDELFLDDNVLWVDKQVRLMCMMVYRNTSKAWPRQIALFPFTSKSALTRDGVLRSSIHPATNIKRRREDVDYKQEDIAHFEKGRQRILEIKNRQQEDGSQKTTPETIVNRVPFNV
jgi:hypothetical protein